MQSTEQHMQERIGSALFRLAEIGQRVEAAESPKAAGRVLSEVRKLANELERMLGELREVATRSAEAQAQATAACRRAERLFELSPVACLLLDGSGTICQANDAAVQILNVSRRHLLGRSFPLFLNGDRDAFVVRLQGLAGDPERFATGLRPRERSKIAVKLTAWRDELDRVMLMIDPDGNVAAEPTSDRQDRLSDDATA